MDGFFTPRGIRNNNPGNIRIGPSRWQGQRAAQGDAEFIEFDEPLMGLRALMRLLLIYNVRHGLDTVASILNRYAPPHENATDLYAHNVASALGVKRTDVIDLKDAAVLAALARAIVRQENGKPPEGGWYPAEMYERAAKMALYQP
jgi:hypothetical protein